MMRSLLQRLKGKTVKTSKTTSQPRDGDLSNGFGAKRLLRSLTPCSGGVQPLERSEVLVDVQVLTRYCAIERPYWTCFLEHYHGLGVRRLQVCVQSEAEAEELLAMGAPEALDLCVHRLPADRDPSAALHSLPFASLAEQAPFTLMVDCDEYLQPLRPDLSVVQLAAVFPQTAQWFFPWLMRPCLEPADQQLGGFWGHVGKPLIRSERMAGVAHDHAFRLHPSSQDSVPGPASAPAGIFGFALVHYWSRSFRDALLKTFNNRFRDAKSADLDQALTLIHAGDLPVRLRLLAYLWVQNGYLQAPNHPLETLDLELEQHMLRRCLSEAEEEICRDSFDRYCEQLRAESHTLPLYPAIPLHALAERLPLPHTRRA
ncbi:hypothetical protein SynRS9909_00205 [Synechococcus sp. RS9909]|uniref:hypothetical protein n=1 Tax=Synechococcus sp. RS9909 TaxID=221352 RepID=UPI0002FF59FE|nr:hypothetical protein [Synechococcus sp. RS9909]QNI78220.1 hypothetical protein SynRS9909_00205 [Synechococcus sp. RS9909]